MSIGIVLIGSLIFAMGCMSATVAIILGAQRISRRAFRYPLYVVAVLLSVPALFAYANTISMLIWPQEAMAEIFPTPLPAGIKPIAAFRDRESDFYALHVALRLDAGGAEWLRQSRQLSPGPMPGLRAPLAGTNTSRPDFWPHDTCGNAIAHSRSAMEAAGPRGLRAFNDVYLLYCPGEGTAYVYAMKVD
jgi:hypothetical protein